LLKKRPIWILTLLAVVSVLVALAVWVGGVALERMYDDLRAEAVSKGMSLTIPVGERNADAERLRADLKAFQDLRPNLRGIEIYTEDPDELSVVMREIRGILPTAYALSSCESYGGRTWGPTTMAALAAVDFLNADGNSAIAERDFPGLLKAAAAIRRIANMFPQEEVIGSAMISLKSLYYCSLLQRAAEAFDKREQIDAIFREADHWAIRSFNVAAAHCAANEMIFIDEEAASPPPDMTAVEKMRHALTTTRTAVKKRKVFALREAIEIYPKWSDDVALVEACEPGTITWSGVRDSFRLLKSVELDLRAAFASLYATLHARRSTISGGELPTMEQLAAAGVETKEPVSGKPYEWRDFEGKKRLFGFHHGHGTPTEGFLLQSTPESIRENARKK
jgi:hypothetical protein